MPWSAYLVGATLVLLAIPRLGEYVAVLIIFAASAVVVGALNPLARLMAPFTADKNIQIVVALTLIGIAIVVAATLLGRRYMRPGLTGSQESIYLNGIILLLGVPAVVGLSFWRVGELWNLK